MNPRRSQSCSRADRDDPSGFVPGRATALGTPVVAVDTQPAIGSDRSITSVAGHCVSVSLREPPTVDHLDDIFSFPTVARFEVLAVRFHWIESVVSAPEQAVRDFAPVRFPSAMPGMLS